MRSISVLASRPRMVSVCSPEVSEKIFGLNCGASKVPLPRQDTICSCSPAVTPMSQIMVGSLGSLSMLIKKESESAFGAFTAALIM